MSYRGDDEAKLAAANLLDNYREQWSESRIQNQEISERIDKFIFGLQTGSYAMHKPGNLIGLLNESVMLTPSDSKTNRELTYRINRFIKHISRRKPKPRLTIKYLRSIQQAYTSAISGNFIHQSLLVTTVMIEVFSNVNLISRTSLIPNSIRNEINEFRNFEDFDEDDDDFTGKDKNKDKDKNKKK